MARDPSGIYTYPDGTRGSPGTTIFSARYNTFLDDLATTLNTALPINMGGTGATTPDTAIAALGGVKRSGDTMTGNLMVTKPNPALVVNKGTGASDEAVIAGYRNAVPRWAFLMGQGTTETGGNVGSDLMLLRYGDAGNYIDAPIGVNRASGNVTFSQTATAINGRLWGASDGNPVWGPIGGTVPVNNVANVDNWQLKLINQNAGASAGSLFLQNGNDANVALGIINNAGNAWKHQFYGNGNYTCTGNINVSNNITAGNAMACVAMQCSGNANFATGYVFGAGSDARIYMYHNAGVTQKGALIFSGEDFFFSNAAGGAMGLNGSSNAFNNKAYEGKQGEGGARNQQGWNFYWTGTGLQGWVQVTNQGNITFSSDYRVKENVVDLDRTWDVVKALRPVKYNHKDFNPPSELQRRINEQVKAEERGERVEPEGPFFKGDDKERWGFIAHEMQETMIEDAATGVKDAPDCIQSPNPWTIIAALTKALQEAMARIEALEARA